MSGSAASRGAASGGNIARGARWLGKEIALDIAAPVTNRVCDARDLAIDSASAGRSFWIGARGLHADGRRSDSRTAVAGEWWHGAADREAARKQLASEFETLHNDLMTTTAVSPADSQWVIDVVVPTLSEWGRFVAAQEASPLAFVTSWGVFESWAERLHRLRELAKSRGIKLASPDPTPLPKTIWQRADSGTGSSLDVLVSALKTVIVGAMALIGAASMYSIVREFSHRRGAHS